MCRFGRHARSTRSEVTAEGDWARSGDQSGPTIRARVAPPLTSSGLLSGDRRLLRRGYCAARGRSVSAGVVTVRIGPRVGKREPDHPQPTRTRRRARLDPLRRRLPCPGGNPGDSCIVAVGRAPRRQPLRDQLRKSIASRRGRAVERLPVGARSWCQRNPGGRAHSRLPSGSVDVLFTASGIRRAPTGRSCATPVRPRRQPTPGTSRHCDTSGRAPPLRPATTRRAGAIAGVVTVENHQVRLRLRVRPSGADRGKDPSSERAGGAASRICRSGPSDLRRFVAHRL